MSLRAEAMKQHPHFPWLDAEDSAGVASVLRGAGLLEPGEAVESCAKAGDGNMNLTLRVVTSNRTFILKQARPWVEKYDHIAAPWDRILSEQRFYKMAASIDAVSRLMPKLLGSDEDARMLVVEDLGEAADYTGAYAGKAIPEDDLRSLAAYLSALHEASRGEPDPEFANRDMRALNHEHIFVIPLAEDNGLELEDFEPGLSEAAETLRDDGAYMSVVGETGERYLADGPCLVHGDFFPGSWLRTADGPRVIDPEFCFYGDAEFDVGVTLAHLVLAQQDRSLAEAFQKDYDGALDLRWVARFASAEVMRRLIGVAQLPIPPSDGFREKTLQLSRNAMLTGELEALWS